MKNSKLYAKATDLQVVLLLLVVIYFLLLN
jgi:hypothetical protein